MGKRNFKVECSQNSNRIQFESIRINLSSLDFFRTWLEMIYSGKRFILSNSIFQLTKIESKLHWLVSQASLSNCCSVRRKSFVWFNTVNLKVTFPSNFWNPTIAISTDIDSENELWLPKTVYFGVYSLNLINWVSQRSELNLEMIYSEFSSAQSNRQNFNEPRIKCN